MDRTRRHDIHPCPEGSLEGIHHVIQASPGGSRSEVDEDIDIAVGSRFSSRSRAKQREALDTELPKFRKSRL